MYDKTSTFAVKPVNYYKIYHINNTYEEKTYNTNYINGILH